MFLLIVDNGQLYSSNQQYIAGYVNTLEEATKIKEVFDEWVGKYKEIKDLWLTYDEEQRFFIENPPPLSFSSCSDAHTLIDMYNWPTCILDWCISAYTIADYILFIKPLEYVTYAQGKSN